MSEIDVFAAYRKMFTSTEDGLVAWWYFGGAFVRPEGFPELPVIQAETVMVYRTETVSADQYKIHWWEIGLFRDQSTNLPVTTWENPVTGEAIKAPASFEEGPACFTITRNGTGIDVHLVQANANVRDVTVTARDIGGRVFLEQVERKIRGFPLPDGTIPDPDTADAFDAVTTLSIFCDRAELDDPATDRVHSSGVYLLELPALPLWMNFGDLKGDNIVRGRMIKSPLIDGTMNPVAWEDLKKAFPQRFDGDRIKPKWG